MYFVLSRSLYAEQYSSKLCWWHRSWTECTPFSGSSKLYTKPVRSKPPNQTVCKLYKSLCGTDEWSAHKSNICILPNPCSKPSNLWFHNVLGKCCFQESAVSLTSFQWLKYMYCVVQIHQNTHFWNRHVTGFGWYLQICVWKGVVVMKGFQGSVRTWEKISLWRKSFNVQGEHYVAPGA